MKSRSRIIGIKNVPAFRIILLLCSFLILTLSSCNPHTPTATLSIPSPVPVPKIVLSSSECKLGPGETTPLAVTGVPGSNVEYSWSASAGNIIPPNGSAVTFNAPSAPGDVIIQVVAKIGDVTSDGMIICKVVAPPTVEPTITNTPIPTNTLVPIPTEIPTPVATAWACTSFRTEKIQTGNDAVGEIKFDTPLQGAFDIPSKQDIQVLVTYTGIPADMYLWVFIYSPDAGSNGRYYPQTKDALKGWQPAPTSGQDGHWSLKINFGAPHLCYEVVMVVADAPASQSIAVQLQKWAAVNSFAGYELNGPVSADPPNAPGFPGGLVEKASIEVKIK